MKHEYTSPAVAQIASKAMKGEPLRPDEIKSLAASALTQAPDKDDLEVVHAHGYDDGYQRGRRDMLEEVKVLLGNM